jgi:hypothetical protein
MNTNPQELSRLARLVIALALLLLIAGVLWHDVTSGSFERIWRNLMDRPSGPMWFRFILQPSMAAIVGVRDGVKDARAGRSPYLWTVLSKPRERMGRLSEGLNATARIILLGLVMDLIYQILELDRFYPNEALIVVLLLAFVPYVIVRGLTLHLWRNSSARRPR